VSCPDVARWVGTARPRIGKGAAAAAELQFKQSLEEKL